VYYFLSCIQFTPSMFLKLICFVDLKMPESGYQVLSSEREEEVRFQFSPIQSSSKYYYISILKK